MTFLTAMATFLAILVPYTGGTFKNNIDTVEDFIYLMHHEMSLYNIGELTEEKGYTYESIVIKETTVTKVDGNEVHIHVKLEYSEEYNLTYACIMDIRLAKYASHGSMRYNVRKLVLGMYSEMMAFMAETKYNAPILHQYYPKKEKPPRYTPKWKPNLGYQPVLPVNSTLDLGILDTEG